MHLICSVVLLYATAVMAVAFVSPGPSDSVISPSISYAIHPLGSKFHIAWSGSNLTRPVSVVLFQYNMTSRALVYPFEYATQSISLVESIDWTVATDKDLSGGDLFLFNFFYDGDTSPSAVSETFRITDDSDESSSSTSSSSTSTTSTATSSTLTTSTVPTTSINTILSTTSTAGTTTSATGQPSSSSSSGDSGGLSVDAKIGVAVAVPVVALLGAAAGYFCYRRRAKRQPPPPAPQPVTQMIPPVNQKPPTPPPFYRYEMEGLDRSQIPVTYELPSEATR